MITIESRGDQLTAFLVQKRRQPGTATNDARRQQATGHDRPSTPRRRQLFDKLRQRQPAHGVCTLSTYLNL